MQDTVLGGCNKDICRFVFLIYDNKISLFYFQPAPNQVTFHLPLHRYFAMFLSKVSTCFSHTEDGNTLLSVIVQYSVCLLLFLGCQMPRTRSGYHLARSRDADETHDSPASDSGTGRLMTLMQMYRYTTEKLLSNSFNTSHLNTFRSI